MNEKRFIELTNLYIDQEISPAELEELENEIASHSQRREVFYKYCRLQRASQEVCRDFGPALAETVDLRKYQILARSAARPLRLGLLYSVGSVAAAGLILFAAVNIFREARSASDYRNPTANGAVAVVEVFEPGKIGGSRALRPGREAKAQVFAARPKPPQAARTADFLESVKASAEKGFHISIHPAAWEDEFRTGSTARIFRSNSSFETPELASFQFQR